MAGNCFESTTETYSLFSTPFVHRGGVNYDLRFLPELPQLQ